jgi:hypothetical protein
MTCRRMPGQERNRRVTANHAQFDARMRQKHMEKYEEVLCVRALIVHLQAARILGILVLTPQISCDSSDSKVSAPGIETSA